MEQYHTKSFIALNVDIIGNLKVQDESTPNINYPIISNKHECPKMEKLNKGLHPF